MRATTEATTAPLSHRVLRHRPLGRSGLMVSEVGFGAWGIGGRTPGLTSYGPTDDACSLRALSVALERGITLFDTSPAYGAGHSETLIGRAVTGSARARVVLATKGGCERYDQPLDFSPESLERSLAASLERLNTDWVDLYQLHNPPPERMARGDDLRALMERWKAAGRIRAFGVSVATPRDGLTALACLAPDAIQANFNLLDQRCDAEGVLDAAQAAGCAVIARTPLCFGFLTGTVSSADLFPEGDHRRRLTPDLRGTWVESGRRMVEAVRAEAGGTPAQIALRFCVWHDALVSAIPGMVRPEEVEENADAAGVLRPLMPEEIRRLRELYTDIPVSQGTESRQGLQK